jgi:DNA-binding NtrC family response regulator
MLALAHRHCDVYGPIAKVEDELVSFLNSHPFPGNVRELENDILRMLFSKTAGTSLGLADWRCRSAEADAEESPDLLGKAAASIWEAISLHGVSYAQAIYQIETGVLEAALKVRGRTRRQVAQCLQTSERTLYQKIRTHRLSSQRGA